MSDKAIIPIGLISDEAVIPRPDGNGYERPPLEMMCALAYASTATCQAIRHVNLQTTEDPMNVNIGQLANGALARAVKLGKLFHCPFTFAATGFFKDTEADQDLDIADYLKKKVRPVLVKLKKNGIKTLRAFGPQLPAGDNVNSYDYVERFLVWAIAFANLCAEFGIGVCFEIETGSVLDRGTVTAEFMEKLTAEIDDPEKVGVIFDFGNLTISHLAIGPQWEAVKKWVVLIHAKFYHDPGLTEADYITDTGRDDLGKRLPKRDRPNYILANAKVPPAASPLGVMADIRRNIDEFNRRARAVGLSGIEIHVESHLIGDGHAGGDAGPLGQTKAVLAVADLCRQAGITPGVHGYDQIVAERNEKYASAA